MLRKITYGLILCFILFSFNGSEIYVYICKGKSSEKYHYKKDCRGLSNLAEAKKLERTLCGWED